MRCECIIIKNDTTENNENKQQDKIMIYNKTNKSIKIMLILNRCECIFIKTIQQKIKVTSKIIQDHKFYKTTTKNESTLEK